jgi:hypothetical protein
MQQPQKQGTDWNSIGQGCQQLGCAIMLIPVVAVFLFVAWGIGCQ